jgi:transposase
VTIVAEQFSYVIGVDTHARTHTLVAVDHLGVKHTQSTFPTTKPGLARAAAWIGRNAPGSCLVAMEGTGSYGAVFADLLQRNGMAVAETRPPKKNTRRAGKSDPIDAELAARHVLALPVERVLVPRKHDGDQAALRVLLTARNAKRKEKTATSNALTALLRGFDYGIDARKPLTRTQIVQIASWRPRPTDTVAMATIRGEIVGLAGQVMAKEAELVKNEAGLVKHVTLLAPWLLDESGIGPVAAAQILASWSMKDRIRSEAAFARLAGAAPIPASSGNTTNHRLDRSGDRQLNRALWVIATTRMMFDDTTKAYVQKRTAAGQSRRAIIRSLKRYIARSLFRKLAKMS